jgi:hypothetical protein
MYFNRTRFLIAAYAFCVVLLLLEIDFNSSQSFFTSWVYLVLGVTYLTTTLIISFIYNVFMAKYLTSFEWRVGIWLTFLCIMTIALVAVSSEVEVKEMLGTSASVSGIAYAILSYKAK